MKPIFEPVATEMKPIFEWVTTEEFLSMPLDQSMLCNARAGRSVMLVITMRVKNMSPLKGNFSNVRV